MERLDGLDAHLLPSYTLISRSGSKGGDQSPDRQKPDGSAPAARSHETSREPSPLASMRITTSRQASTLNVQSNANEADEATKEADGCTNVQYEHRQVNGGVGAA